MTLQNTLKKRLPLASLLGLLILALFIIAGIFWVTSRNSDAADVSKFNPGNIMSDATMSNKGTMNVQQIQNFLNSKNACNNTNTYLASYYPHLRYNIQNGRFVCMAQERFNGKTAAQIIWEVAQQYTINPQVLIVLLEKEQGLVSDTWPNHVQYRTATGFGCPDTAPCDSQYYGLENQLKLAAKLFREVLNGGWSNYPVGYTYVQYNPNAACGGSVIHIQNRATSALYRYTPYQPNRSALNAGYGTGDACGAYGNRNFWMLFTDWFGSTHDNPFTRLDTPRWMEVARDNTQKIDIMSGFRVGEPLNQGRQLRLIDKALRSNQWHLRTEYNHLDKGPYAIPMSNLREISYLTMQPKFVTFTVDGNRSHPASRTSVGDKLSKGTAVKVSDKITINGNLYYRTEFNKNNNQDVGIHSRFLTDGIKPIQLEGPRNFCPVESAADKIKLSTGQSAGTTTEPTLIKNKIFYNGKWYFQSVDDQGSDLFIPSDKLTDHKCYTYVAFEGPRDMKLSEDVDRFNPYTKEVYDTLEAGRIIHFSSKMLIDDVWYYRTTSNTSAGIDAVIPASAITDL